MFKNQKTAGFLILGLLMVYSLRIIVSTYLEWPFIMEEQGLSKSDIFWTRIPMWLHLAMLILSGVFSLHVFSKKRKLLLIPFVILAVLSIRDVISYSIGLMNLGAAKGATPIYIMLYFVVAIIADTISVFLFVSMILYYGHVVRKKAIPLVLLFGSFFVSSASPLMELGGYVKYSGRLESKGVAVTLTAIGMDLLLFFAFYVMLLSVQPHKSKVTEPKQETV